MNFLKITSRSILCVLLIVGTGSLALGQTTGARPDRGISAGSSYSVSDIESVSLTNGNLHLSIPLASLPPMAGGKMGFTVSAVYDSKLWNVNRKEFQTIPFYNCATWIVETPQLSDQAGWRIGGGYKVVFRNAHLDFDFVKPQELPGPSCEQNQQENLQLQNEWYRAVLLDPDGSEHELRPVDNNSIYGGTREYLRNYYKDTPDTLNQAMRYYTFDGTYISVIINPSSSSTKWTATLKDGTRIVEGPDAQRITDTNGNSVKIFTDVNAVTHYQDELTGREIKVSANRDKVWYQSTGGTWFSVDLNWGTTRVEGKITRHDSWNEQGGESGQGESCWFNETLQETIPVLRSIVFPVTVPNQAGRQFTFAYNSDQIVSATDPFQEACGSGAPVSFTRNASKGMGALSQMITPLGATVKYSYSQDGVHAFSGPGDINNIARETVTKKEVFHNGLPDPNVPETWTYTFDANGQFYGQVDNPDGTFSADTRYASNPGYGFNFGQGGKAGLVYHSFRSNKEVIDRQWTIMPFAGANTGGTASFNPATFNPVVTREYRSILDDTQSHNVVAMSATFYTYDYNGNLLTTTDYDWFSPTDLANLNRNAEGIPTIVPSAPPLRVTNHQYYNPASDQNSANVYAKRLLSTNTPLILNALKQTTLGTSVVQLSYDNQAYGTAPTTGNLTSQQVWDDVDNKWITTSSTYDTHGNVITATNGRGKVTTYSYDSTFAKPTSVTVDPQNGTGAQTSSVVYDFSTGLVTSQTDVNGQTSTIDYTNQLLGTVDPFGRPGIVKAPTFEGQRRRVTTTYADHLREVIVASDLNTENDQLLKVKTTVDQLGRSIKSERMEDGANYTLLTRSAYLDMGRVTLTSNAMRPSPAPSPSPTPGTTDSWTRVTRDAAGRVSEVATFGGYNQPAWSGTSGKFTGRVLTTHEGEYTTVADQTGKLRRTKMDALGRMVRVDEPNDSNNLGSLSAPVQPTVYEYDVFGNLTKVTQASQTTTQVRNFNYDTLSRLRRAENPESGTVIYEYDDASNLIVKTDARGLSAHFSYDSLNRVTRKWFNTSPSSGDQVHSVPSAIGATAELSYKYDTQTVQGGPTYSPGANVGRLVAQLYGTGTTTGNYFAYDVLGRVTLKIQRTGAKDYDIHASYDLSGGVKQLTYPSTRSVTNIYDSAGRLNKTEGNLGGGNSRIYSKGILYSPTGNLIKEEFGTATPIFNKLFYNSRGQLAEIRESTSYTGPGDTTWNRGAIINFYSEQCWGMCADGNGPQAMSDNNGNLLKQAIYIPNNEANTSYHLKWQQYSYDSLNRLQWAREILDGGSEQWRQWFKYDRWGNRTFDFTVEQGQSRTYGGGLVNKVFEVEETTNRLLAQNDTGLSATQRKMRYDDAGNLQNDSWSSYGTDTAGVVTRKYDGENRMTSAWNSSGGVSDYTYDGSGNRIKSKTGNSETWLVYGFAGELLAEYAADSAKELPQKEYGYRNGQLLITAEPPVETQPSMNVALFSNGATATASSTLDSGRTATAAINGDRKGQHWGTDPSTGSGWHCATYSTYPDTLEILFNGSKTIVEVDIFAVQDNYTSPVEPTEAMTTSIVGITAFSVEYWNGSSWATIPGASVTGNTKVWRKFTFSAITTTKIRVSITGAQNFYSRLAEVEAWTPGPAPNPRVNVAMTANGGSATASTTLDSGRTPEAAINGDRKGQHWGTDPSTGSGWHDATNGTWPDWIQVEFGGAKVIDELNVISVQDDPGNPIEPTLSTTFTQYGASSFKAFYWDGSQWVLIPGIDITGNNKVWRQFTFSAITTTKIKLEISASPNQTWAHSRVVELEAFGTNPTTPVTAKLQWLVADQLGTPRMIFDETGSLANTKRHDYAPFGEELPSGISGRTGAQGYGGGDGVRQQFTEKERDIETGLDYFMARYYSSIQGRFASVDPANAGATLSDPQTFNGYSYVRGTPSVLVDPDGLGIQVCVNGACHTYGEREFAAYKKDAEGDGFIFRYGQIYYNDTSDTEHPHYVFYGTYQSDMNDLAVGVSKSLAARNDSFQRFGQITMTAESFLIGGLTTIGSVGTLSLGIANPTPGILAGNVAGLSQGELKIAQWLIARGRNVEVLERSNISRTADFLVDGVTTEVKTVNSAGPTAVKSAIEKAAKQGYNIIVDARNAGINQQAAAQQIMRAHGNIGNLVGRVTVLTKGGLVVF